MNAVLSCPKALQHPLLALLRPSVTTRAMESLGTDMAGAIDARYKGLSVYGFTQAGKTRAARYFMAHPDRIHPRYRAAAIFWDAPDVKLRTDTSFYRNWLLARRIRLPGRALSGELQNLVVADLVETAQQADTDLIVVFIDEAQRMLAPDYEHLVSLDNSLVGLGFFLFVVFIYQRDVTGYTNEATNDADFPPHVTCRFRVRKHLFEGLRSPEDAHFVLSRYDDATEWPADSGISYTRHFMPLAYERGWRLAREAKRLFTQAEQLRADHRLPPNWTWPMRSFEATVVYLLTVVGPARYEFDGFTDAEVREALLVVGFIEMELSRATFEPKAAL